jgi:hypothetical protein
MHAIALRDDGLNWIEGVDTETRYASAGLIFGGAWPGLTVLQNIMAKVCPGRGHEVVAWIPDNRPVQRRKADRRAVIVLACKEGDGQTVSIPDTVGPHHVVAVGPDGRIQDIEANEVATALDELMAKVCPGCDHEIVATVPDNRARRPADRGQLIAMRCRT